MEELLTSGSCRSGEEADAAASRLVPGEGGGGGVGAAAPKPSQH
jgi:hypothetical protein